MESNEHPPEMGASGPAAIGCRFAGDALISYVYDEETPAERDRIRAHVASCALCRKEAASLQETIQLVEASGATSLPEPALEDEWPRLRARLVASTGTYGSGGHGRRILKAAGVTLMVGASFLLGRSWQSSGGSISGLWRELTGGAPLLTDSSAPGSQAPLSAEEEAARLREFARETNGYLNRSRLVLLAFSNDTEGETAVDLSRASASLLREADRARRLATEMRDPRLSELLSSLERILGEIARLSSAGDGDTMARFRDSVNLSSVLDQLELLAGSSGRHATERPNA